jgi:hypothetical protein
MNFLTTLYTAFLFFILTPGIFLSIPKGGDLKTVALTHAAVFGLVYHFTHMLVYKATSGPVVAKKSKYGTMYYEHDDGKMY